MKTAWTQHLKTQEEKDRFHNSVIGSRLVLERLATILTEKEKGAERVIQSLSSYDSPSWSFKAADNNGYSRAIAEIKSLINLDQQKDIYNQ